MCAALSVSAAFATAPVWRAQHEAVYEPSEEDETKMLLSYNTSLTYNNLGKILKEEITTVEGERSRIITTYDAAGRVTTETAEALVGDTWVKTEYKEYAYDERTGVIISRLGYTYKDGKENPGNCYKFNIVRDAAGNVTSTERSVLYEGKFAPTERMTITYDESGKAVSIACQALAAGSEPGQFVWVEAEQITDIVWHESDGQITSVEDLYRGTNRIASAHYVNTNGGEPYDDYDIKVTYAETGSNFTSVFTGMYQGIADTGVRHEYEETERPEGGIETSLFTSYYSLTDETLESENYINLLIVDAYGLEIERSETFWFGEDDSEKDVMGTYGKVEYDTTEGYPLTVTFSDGDEAFLRVDFSNYVDCTTLNSLRQLRAAAADDVEWFDLAGRKVARPSNGVYIMRHGTETSRRFIR